MARGSRGAEPQGQSERRRTAGAQTVKECTGGCTRVMRVMCSRDWCECGMGWRWASVGCAWEDNRAAGTATGTAVGVVADGGGRIRLCRCRSNQCPPCPVLSCPILPCRSFPRCPSSSSSPLSASAPYDRWSLSVCSSVGCSRRSSLPDFPLPTTLDSLLPLLLHCHTNKLRQAHKLDYKSLASLCIHYRVQPVDARQHTHPIESERQSDSPLRRRSD